MPVRRLTVARSVLLPLSPAERRMYDAVYEEECRMTRALYDRKLGTAGPFQWLSNALYTKPPPELEGEAQVEGMPTISHVSYWTDSKGGEQLSYEEVLALLLCAAARREEPS